MVFQWILCGHVLQSNVSLLHALLHRTPFWLSVLPFHFHLCFTKHLRISSQLDLCFTGFYFFIFLFLNVWDVVLIGKKIKFCSIQFLICFII